jgi:hypothetical protein
LDPDQSPLAEQLEALDELQVSVTLELMETEFEFEDKETLAEGVGGVPEPDPPPPPQETVKVNKKSKANILICIQRPSLSASSIIVQIFLRIVILCPVDLIYLEPCSSSILIQVPVTRSEEGETRKSSVESICSG